MITEQEMRERLAPLIEAKLEVFRHHHATMLISPGGDLLSVHYPPEMLAEMKQVDDLIDLEWKRAETEWNIDTLVAQEIK